MPFAATWMDPEIITVREASHKEEDVSYDITYIWYLKKIQMSLLTKRKYIHRQRKQTYGYQRE